MAERYFKFEITIDEEGRANVNRDFKGLLVHEMVGILEIEKAVLLGPVLKASEKEEPTYSVLPDEQ